MQTIYPLPPQLISKIAAGEVIDRPSSALKELIENSLDAEAEHIEIILEKGGMKIMAVKDDGIGMNKEDLLECFKPHTTSKIKSESDLEKIVSFGFRGEALASIAAVSTVTMKSRRRGEESGTMLELVPHHDPEWKSIGMPQGTEIIVEDLFSTIPARKKFMKDAKSELRSCLEVVTTLALAHPAQAFRVVHDGITHIDVPSKQKLHERIESLLGDEMSTHHMNVHHHSPHVSISGFIGKPQIARGSRSLQFLFVNNRAVDSIPLSRIITESFGSLIEPRTHAAFVLHLIVPPQHVDVNIHPRKTEVAFLNNNEIEQALKTIVHIALENNNLTYQASSNSFSGKYGMDGATASMLKELVTPWNLKSETSDEILQIHNLYLIAPTTTGFLLIDQHAAHERILFEQFKQAFKDKQQEKEIVELSEPLLLHLSAADSLVLEKHLMILQDLGFDIEPFGTHTFSISSMPRVFKDRNIGELMSEMIHDAKEGRAKDIDTITTRTLNFLACRSAIKAGEPLAHSERKNLVEKLLSMPEGYTCPHGRPTHIEVKMRELDKMFKRA